MRLPLIAWEAFLQMKNFQRPQALVSHPRHPVALAGPHTKVWHPGQPCQIETWDNHCSCLSEGTQEYACMTIAVYKRTNSDPFLRSSNAQTKVRQELLHHMLCSYFTGHVSYLKLGAVHQSGFQRAFMAAVYWLGSCDQDTCLMSPDSQKAVCVHCLWGMFKRSEAFMHL